MLRYAVEIIYHDSNVLRVFPAGVLYYITRARYLSFFFLFWLGSSALKAFISGQADYVFI
jgi:hypothetical protein